MASKKDFLKDWEKEFNECPEKTILSLIKNAVRNFSRENNCNRQFVNKLDGLKPVYRRVFYSTLRFPDKLQKTAKIVGDTMGSFHPHGDRSISPVVSEFVGYGVFTGQGQHGVPSFLGNDTSPAAMRYTEAKLNPVYREFIDPVMKFVPFKDGELEEQEPCYIPTPIPFAIRFGSKSVGTGANADIPALDAKSLHKAMLADDPNLLEASYGLELVKSECDLDGIWNRGEGKLTYRFKVSNLYDEVGRLVGVSLSGKPKLFKPRLNKESDDDSKSTKKVTTKSPMSQVKSYADDELITITENSKEFKLEIRLNPRIKKITVDDLRTLVEKAAVYRRKFKIMVTDGQSLFKIPLKNWLRECYDNYINLITSYRSGNLDRLKFEYKVYEWLPKVGKEYANNRELTREEINDRLKIGDIRIVNAIMSKSISQLGVKDTTDKLNSIQSEIDKFEGMDPVTYTEDIISKL